MSEKKKDETLEQEKAIVQKKDNKLKTTSDRYIDQLTKESEKVMISMGLELKPEVKMALFNLGLSCEKAIKDKGINWEQVNIDGLASKLLHYAQLGLSPANNELYIYTNATKNGKFDLSFEESYFGKSKKVKKFSIDGLEEIIAFLVREGDTYEPDVDLIEGDTLNYKPEPFNDKPLVGAVCYLKFNNANKNRITEMTLKELEKVKEASIKKMNGKLSPAWKNWESEMQKKAVLKRAIKNVQIEVPAEYQAAFIATEEMDDSNYDLNFEERKTVVINKSGAIDAEFDEKTGEVKVTEEPTKEEEIDLHKTDEEVTNDSDYVEFE